ILILLLVIGYAARALGGGSRTGSQPAGPRLTSSAVAGPRFISSAVAGAGWPQLLPQPAQDGGRFAA
ncbi:MAG: hypothetical protein QOI26_2459, partial [Pseudonocardiales bacterium]|nr:hypothetical protein [Pseudonocardiales bacterium]